jgi:hypothetical protein
MLDDAMFTAFGKVKSALKQKYPRRSDRIFYLILILGISVIPIVLFDYWFGRISGLILVSLMFFSLISKTKEQKEKIE